jgi:hypothetical protein
MKKHTTLLSLTIFLAGFSACIPSPPKTGFRVSTTRTTIMAGSPLPTTVNAPNIFVDGNVLSVPCCVQIVGTIGAFSGTTNSDAYYDVTGGKTPARWRLGEGNGPCAGQSVTIDITFAGSTRNLDCRDLPSTFFSFLPSVIQRDTPPATITIEGTGISSTGGMPTVEYYDLNGTLVAQNTAIEVASGGTALTAPAPNTSLFASGAFIALVRNADGNSPGNGVVVIFDFLQPPPDDPPDEESCGFDICPVREGEV